MLKNSSSLKIIRNPWFIKQKIIPARGKYKTRSRGAISIEASHPDRNIICISTTNHHVSSHSAFTFAIDFKCVRFNFTGAHLIWVNCKITFIPSTRSLAHKMRQNYIKRRDILAARPLSTLERVTPMSLRHPRPSERGVCVCVCWSFNRHST